MFIASGDRPVPPENSFFDYLILFPFWISMLIFVQCGLLYLLLDLLKLILLPLYKKYKAKLLPIQAKIVLAIAALFILYVPVRVIYDFNTVSLRVVEFKKQNLPEDLIGFKIAFISDIQADRYTNNSRLQRFISKVNSTNPDLVLIAGDMITSTPNYINTSAKYVGELKSKYGIYSCIGDHDNWAYWRENGRSVKEITDALKKYNVQMIDNGSKVIGVNKSQVRITFITNTYVEKVSDEILDSLAQLEKNYDLKIFLTHQPRNKFIESAVKHNYNLLLNGHTHGGQVTFFFPFHNLSATMIETKYVRGDFYFGNMLMIVTRGLGMSLLPLRYNSTSEVTLIVLNKK
jgi:predicted MPP superfamily phosphohydrolase